MTKDWRTAVRDSDARQVLEALEDPEWDFRTINGIAKATGLPRKRIRTVLGQYGEYVRESPLKSRKGERLWTMKSKGRAKHERGAETRAFLAKRFR